MSEIIKIMALNLITLVLVLMSSLESHAAASSPDSLVCSFHFRLGDDLLMKDYRDNKRNFEAMEQWMTAENIDRISNIKIVGTASPEGVLEFNNLLSLKRAEAVRKYILYRWKMINKQTVIANRQTDYLSAWVLAIQNDPSVPRREKVLEILNSNASIQTKWANIQLLTGGASQYISKYIFPQLRNAVACIVTLKEPEDNQVATEMEVEVKNDTLDNKKTEVKIETEKVIEELPVVADDKSVSIEENAQKILKPLFALKTNLLFDAASLLNVEVEVPIGKHWSVAGELIFPWWLWENKQHCLQVLSGNIEVKYWFGDREVMPNGKKRPVMTRWHAGIYAGGGYYDLEWDKAGYQGEFFIAAGISAGFTHTINKSGNLRLEYSLGIGYMQTNYRKYDAEQDANGEWHLYRSGTGKYTWIGPTRARVSLVWLIHSKKQGGSLRW